MMRRPLGGARLAENLRELRVQGVDLLVCALDDVDRTKLHLTAEASVARAVGLPYREFPIVDFGTPDRNALIQIGRDLANEVRAGQFVVVHCRGGVGRTGLIVGTTLVGLGAGPDEAMRLMTSARGHRSPETGPQKALLRGLPIGLESS